MSTGSESAGVLEDCREWLEALCRLIRAAQKISFESQKDSEIIRPQFEQITEACTQLCKLLYDEQLAEDESAIGRSVRESCYEKTFISQIGQEIKLLQMSLNEVLIQIGLAVVVDDLCVAHRKDVTKNG